MRKIIFRTHEYRLASLVFFMFLLPVWLTGTQALAGQGLQPLKKLPEAPGFALPDLDGKTLQLSDLKGKVVVVNFWATWCPPCRAEMPSMERASAALKKHNVVFVGVHVGGNEDKVWTFVTDLSLSFPIVLDKGGKVSRKWPMRGLPTTFVVDTGGRIAYQAIGGREWGDKELMEKIAKLAENR